MNDFEKGLIAIGGSRFDDDVRLAVLAYASFGSAEEIRQAVSDRQIETFKFPETYRLPIRERVAATIDRSRESGYFGAVFVSENDRKVVLAIRNADQPRDYIGPVTALMRDGDLLGAAGVPLAPKGEGQKRQMAALQEAILPGDGWHPHFADALDHARALQKAYGPQGYSFEVTGHGLGGADAQLIAHTLGWSGRAWDPLGAKNVVNSDGYKEWLQRNGIDAPRGMPPQTPQPFDDRSFVNYAVRFSPVSDKSGPHLGAVQMTSGWTGRDLKDAPAYAASTAANVISELPLVGEIAMARGGAAGRLGTTVAKEVGQNAVITALDDARHDMARLVRLAQDAAEHGRWPVRGHVPDADALRSPVAHAPGPAGFQPAGEMRTPGHPAHGAFLHAGDCVRRMEATAGLQSTDAQRERMAAAVAAGVEQAGMTLQRVELGEGGTVLAIQRGPYPHFEERRLSIDSATALSQPVETSTREWMQARSPHYAAAPMSRAGADVAVLDGPPARERALFDAVRGRTPPGVADAHVLQAAAAGMQRGIDAPERLRDVLMAGDAMWVVGHVPGQRARVDVSGPAPAMHEAVDALLQQGQQRQDTLAQNHVAAQAVESVQRRQM